MKLIRIGLVAVLFAGIIGFSSCKKDPTPVSPTVKFTTTQASYGEDQGTVGIGVTLSAVQKTDVVVSYTWTSSDTSAFLGADFTFATSGTVTILAGQTTGTLGINIIDDTQIDGDNKLTLTLVSVTSANATLSSTSADLSFDLTITDNDAIADETTEMHIDLYWFGPTPTTNINNYTLQLYLQQGVVWHDTTLSGQTFPYITGQGTPYLTAKATSGFQTIVLHTTDTHQDYFIYAVYTKGVGAVDFAMVLNGLGKDNYLITGSFDASEQPTSGAYFSYVGPFTLSDGLFSRGTSLTPARLKAFRAEYFKQK